MTRSDKPAPPRRQRQSKTPPTETMVLRLPPQHAARVRQLAEEGDRTISQQLRRLVAAALELPEYT